MFRVLATPLVKMIIVLAGRTISSITVSSLSLLVSITLDSSLKVVSFSIGRTATLSISVKVPLATYFSIVLTTCSACAGVILMSDPAASNTLLIDSSTADLLGTFSPSAFSGAASTAFSVGTSISTLPPINTLSSSFGFSVSGFSIRVTLTVVLDTWPLSTGAINAVYT